MSATSHQADFAVLNPVEAELLLRKIDTAYAHEGIGTLWERMHDQLSVQSTDGWTRIDDFVNRMAFILFFEKRDDSTMIAFPNGTRLTPILSECPLFEFYVTDDAASFVVCFNHHDFLIGTGQATSWISSLSAELL